MIYNMLLPARKEIESIRKKNLEENVAKGKLENRIIKKDFLTLLRNTQVDSLIK